EIRSPLLARAPASLCALGVAVRQAQPDCAPTYPNVQPVSTPMTVQHEGSAPCAPTARAPAYRRKISVCVAGARQKVCVGLVPAECVGRAGRCNPHACAL